MTLRTNRIEFANGIKGVETEYLVDGTAKVWVSFHQAGTQAINESLNISSLTDVGVGQSGLTFTNPFSSSYYAALGTPKCYSNGYMSWNQNPSTTALMPVVRNDAATLVDDTYCSVSATGDLA